MDYNRNIDKFCYTAESSLYNSVLNIEATVTGAEPLTIDEVKSWGKIEQDTDDDLITELIIAAREVLEDFTGIGFIERDLVVTLENSNGGFKLPYGPVAGDPTGVDVNDNVLDLTYHAGILDEPRGRMDISYTGGYTDLPKKFKVAIKEQFLFMYENRGESAIGLSPMAQMLLAPVRMVV